MDMYRDMHKGECEYTKSMGLYRYGDMTNNPRGNPQSSFKVQCWQNRYTDSGVNTMSHSQVA